MKMALKGIRVVEMLGLAPGPFCGTILADFGAQVTVVQKILPNPFEVLSNGKRMLSIDLKSKEGVEAVKKLCLTSDVILDTFRPGVMEKIGLGPDALLKQNPKLIYARLTGYGQDGYYKFKAGHDINYVAMSGLLSRLSKNNDPPAPPLNLLADFAGGSYTCVIGILLALFERNVSGEGQIIDCSMTEGASYLGTWVFKSKYLPIWGQEPGNNALDGGLPCYMSYKTKDGKFMAVGALEPQFYSNFLKGLQLSEEEYSQTQNLEESKKKFQEIFLTKTQEEWCAVFENLDACVTPVLDFESLENNKLLESRKSFYKNSDDLMVPEVAPRLSRTPGKSVGKNLPPEHGQHTIEILKELGYKNEDINKLIQNGHVYGFDKCKL